MSPALAAPVIETERLRLRGWSLADFEPFAAIYADGEHTGIYRHPGSDASAVLPDTTPSSVGSRP